jgi:hypothetical protein
MVTTTPAFTRCAAGILGTRDAGTDLFLLCSELSHTSERLSSFVQICLPTSIQVTQG